MCDFDEQYKNYKKNWDTLLKNYNLRGVYREENIENFKNKHYKKIKKSSISNTNSKKTSQE